MTVIRMVHPFYFFRRFLPWLALAVAWSPAAAWATVEIIEHPESRVGVPLTSEVEFKVIASGQGDLKYQWRLNGVNIRNATGQTYIINWATSRDAGIYTVAVGDDNGYITSRKAELTLALPGIGGVGNGIFDGRHPLLLPSGILRADNLEAILEEGEPRHAGKRGGKSIWFEWTAPVLEGDGILTISTAGSAIDTLLGVYQGQNVAELESVAFNDDEQDSFLTSRVQFNVVAGETYQIAVDGFAGGTGDIIIEWNFEPTEDFLPLVFMVTPGRTAPPGALVDLEFETDRGVGEWFHDGRPLEIEDTRMVIPSVGFDDVGSYTVRVRSEEGREVLTQPERIQIHSNADGSFDPESTTFTKFQEASERMIDQVLDPLKLPLLQVASSGPSTGHSSTQMFSTYGSSKEPEEPNHCGEAGGSSEWYAFQAPRSGALQINTNGSNFNTVLAVYTGPGDSYDSLAPVACNNAPGNGGDLVYFPAEEDTVYWIAVDGVGGATGTVSLNINLGDPVEIVNPPSSQTVAAGDPVTFEVNATGSPDLEYTWFLAGEPIAGENSSSLTIASAAEEHAGDYTVSVRNLVNEVVTSPAVLTVNFPPSITAHPASLTVNEGDPVSFSVSATGTAPLEYQWRFGEGDLTGETGPVLEIAAATPSDEGEYSVFVSNMAGSQTSGAATLSVNTPPSITAHPESQTVNPGDPVSFSVSATGTAPLEYQWYFGLAELSGESGPVLELASAGSEDAGDYSVTVTNMAGSLTSSAATLTVNAPPEITMQPLGRTITSGAEATLTVAATGSPAPDYQWLFDDAELPGKTDPVLTIPGFQALHEGVYKVQVVNSLGTEVSETVRLALDSPPRIESMVLNGSGFRFQFVGPAETEYRVEASETLDTWTSLGTYFSTSGFLDFTDSAASGMNFRYYRVVESEE